VIGSDDYTLRARVAPALAAVAAPVTLTLTSIPFASSEAKIVPLVVAAFIVIAGQLGRDAGERGEAAMFTRWGGPPTTALLRHPLPGKPGLSEAMLARRHRQLELMWGGGLRAPTAEEQQAEPVRSDRVLSDLVAVLRARTRDSGTYPLVLAENINYGFRRNCLGLRSWAIWLAALTIVGSLAAGSLLVLHHATHSGYAFVLPLAVGLLSLMFWKSVTDDWVHKAARRYASALIETLEILPSANSEGSHD
jgi:hypothetical protein